MSSQGVPSDQGHDAVREFFLEAEEVPPPGRPPPRLALIVSVVLAGTYSLTTAAVCATYLDIWPFRVDGPNLRDIAIAWVFPVGVSIESVVGISRAFFAIFTGSNELALLFAWPISFVLCLLTAAAQSTLVVGVANACVVIVRRLFRRDK